MMDLAVRDDSTDSCQASNDYNGHAGLRILAVFIILISSGLGVYFPILSSRYSFIRLPNWCFFIAKFFGSGVIVATAFVHLLQPAAEALGDECLGGTFAEYPWAFGICLMSLFLLFFTEIITHYYVAKTLGHDHGDLGEVTTTDVDAPSSEFSMRNMNSNAAFLRDEAAYAVDNGKNSYKTRNEEIVVTPEREKEAGLTGTNYGLESGNAESIDNGIIPVSSHATNLTSVPGKDRYSHEGDHQVASELGTRIVEEDKEQYLNQMLAVFILEFGIIFHSVFVGLSLSVAGEEFETLFIVLTFHQMFEGLGLGTRVAETNWPESKRYTPWLMGLAFTLTSPIAVAIGIGVRHSWIPGSRRALIANGVFDSISSGILIYTGLVELMAHEFLYSNQFKGPDGLRKMLSAYFIMCCGAALMALLGKWA
ncbi:zrt2p [Saccharomyces arboricola H-6]|uniref:Zrt2p n=1 Tax=Saccharomyces arboricola (strain H-6 / AS 2.3317 / CBS 10644) TaxID=1160507 RepID=J8Q559_SACAR|nr:zrt2p [Saccharomyces arboricola H-6]